MDLKIEGTVAELLEVQSGTSQRGEWRKQEFILDVPGEYPRKVCIVMWGDTIDRFALKPGENITAHIDLASREYNGRWYTDVKAWKVEKSDAGSDFDFPPPGPEPLPESDELDDDLPF